MRRRPSICASGDPLSLASCGLLSPWQIQESKVHPGASAAISMQTHISLDNSYNEKQRSGRRRAFLSVWPATNNANVSLVCVCVNVYWTERSRSHLLTQFALSIHIFSEIMQSKSLIELHSQQAMIFNDITHQDSRIILMKLL